MKGQPTDRVMLAVAILALIVSGCRASSEAESSVVIADVTVISADRATPLEHAWVRIEEGRIAEVSTESLAGAVVIEGTGRYLIPGLIDTHVHLSQIPGMPFNQAAAHPEIAATARAHIPRSYLYFGFTTVLDLGGLAEDAAIWNSVEDGPDAYFCGSAPLANGYPMVYLPESLRYEIYKYALYDERQAADIPASIDAVEHTPEAVVEQMADDGAICVKTYYEPGFGSFGGQLPTPPLQMIQDLVAAAHGRDMPVFIHANSLDAHAFALAAGADSTAHGMWNGLPDGDALGAEVEELIATIVANDVGYQPTQQVLHGLVDIFDEHFLADAALAEAVPAPLLAWYSTDEAQFFREGLERDFGGADPAVALGNALRQRDRVLARLAEADARLLFGTDTPSAPTYANPPGLNGRLEMRAWIAAGVDEAQLFRALTVGNAEAIGLANDIGTIGPGKLAHLLLLRENPLDDVEAYDSIETVFVAGRPIAREELSARSAP
jgi:imidazolonepropionase-like amidohydrolase